MSESEQDIDSVIGVGCRGRLERGGEIERD